MTPKQLQGQELGHITPLKAFFTRTKSKEILTAELYNNLQRALSPQDTLFVGNSTLFKKNNPQYNAEIYDLFLSYVEIDSERLPPRFKEVFDLEITDADIEQQILSLFKKARMLDKKSARVLFIDDKIIIFRNEEKLVHPDTKTRKLTQAEKKRTKITTTFNTFENIYDAIRSQYYTVQSSQKSKTDYKYLQQDILQLAHTIKTLGAEGYDPVFSKKLETIIKSIESATNAKILAANLQNLKEISYNNTSIDSNHLLGAKNKLKKRFEDLTKMIGIVESHLISLEEILILHEHTLDLLFAQSKLDMDPSLLIGNYNKAFRNIPAPYQHISPFCDFHKALNNYKNNKQALISLIKSLHTIYNSYQQEHAEKLSSS